MHPVGKNSENLVQTTADSELRNDSDTSAKEYRFL